MSRIEKAIDTEIRLVAAKFGGGRAVMANEYRVFWGSDANVLKLIVMIVTQICGYPENH